MGGEGSAAHTDDTGVLHGLHHLLDGQCVGVGGSLDFFADGILEIVLDDYGHHVAAHGIGTGLDSLHLAGNAGVDGSAETTELTDLLANLHLVTHLDQGSAGCAKVHRHRDDHLSRGRELLDGLCIGRGLHVMGMNAAKESVCHCLSPHFYSLIATIQPFPSLHRPEEEKGAMVLLPHTAIYSTPDFHDCPVEPGRFM